MDEGTSLAPRVSTQHDAWRKALLAGDTAGLCPQRAQAQRRRIDRSLPSGKRPWRRQRGQLAADDAKRQVHPHAAALLAERDTTVDPRRHLEATADPASDCTVSGKRGDSGHCERGRE
jgi:hypothetical protein